MIVIMIVIVIVIMIVILKKNISLTGYKEKHFFLCLSPRKNFLSFVYKHQLLLGGRASEPDK